MELNKPRGVWIGLQNKTYLLKKTQSYKKKIVWIVWQTHLWIKHNKYLINPSLNMILH